MCQGFRIDLFSFLVLNLTVFCDSVLRVFLGGVEMKQVKEMQDSITCDRTVIAIPSSSVDIYILFLVS